MGIQVEAQNAEHGTQRKLAEAAAMDVHVTAQNAEPGTQRKLAEAVAMDVHVTAQNAEPGAQRKLAEAVAMDVHVNAQDADRGIQWELAEGRRRWTSTSTHRMPIVVYNGSSRRPSRWMSKPMYRVPSWYPTEAR